MTKQITGASPRCGKSIKYHICPDCHIPLKQIDKTTFCCPVCKHKLKALDKRQIFQSSVLKTLKRIDYRTCECGCEVNTRYPCYRNDGTSFVKCQCCGRTIETGKWKESLP